MSKLAVMINSLSKASLTGKEVSVENSAYNRSILTTLLDSGWIMSYSVDKSSRFSRNSVNENLPDDDIKAYRKLKVSLQQAYFDTSISSTGGINLKTKQISKPSKRVYKTLKELKFWKLNSTGHHTIIVTTPKGVMTMDQAIAANQGGEVLFSVSK